MKNLPTSIIGKSIQIRFVDGGSQNINKIKKINGNEIFDEKGNIYHINLEKIGSIFEPKSKNYQFRDLKNSSPQPSPFVGEGAEKIFKEFDDFSDLEK